MRALLLSIICIGLNMNTLNKAWIGKRCAIVIKGLNEEKFYYTALVLDINESLITIEDKFKEIITFNIDRVIQINELKDRGVKDGKNY